MFYSSFLSLTVTFPNHPTEPRADCQEIVLNENQVTYEAPNDPFHEIIQELHHAIVSASSRQIFIFFAQQISSSTKHRIPEVKYQIKLNKFGEAESLSVLELQLGAKIDKVLILKVPIVENEIVQREICLINFPLKFHETKRLKLVKLHKVCALLTMACDL